MYLIIFIFVAVKDSFILDYDTNGQKTFACEFVGSTNLAAGREITSGGATSWLQMKPFYENFEMK